ncbi:hypothetical protein BC943DRAFT_362376 [Umbelopsis sp. AD052]|nr:hypothetical protein BC943DRAFT_362376 [Umbelopsis sp. AD052]
MAQRLNLQADDENTLFQETHFSRYGYERTNIFGSVILETSLPTYLECAEEFPSTRYDSLPYPPTREAPTETKKSKHLLSISASELNAFVACNGYWNGLCIPLGIETGKLEIISVDAFEHVIEDNLGGLAKNMVVCITTAERSSEENPSTNYELRIYGGSRKAAPYLEQTLFNIVGTCQLIKVDSAPMQLNHVSVKQIDGNTRTAILLSSTDGIVHMYCQSSESDNFLELDVGDYFPILGKMAEQRQSVLFLDIYDHDQGRILCAGGQNGELCVGVYNLSGVETASYSTRLFSPISSVKIYNSRSPITPDILNDGDSIDRILQDECDTNIVVTCAVERAIIYHSVPEVGLQNAVVLPESSHYDSVLCSHVMDVDWDGQNEIIIGTYGKQILIYKKASPNSYFILWQRQFSYPIYRVVHLDINHDGLDELIVTTMYGVHILQPNLKMARAQLLRVLEFAERMKRRVYNLLREQQTRREMENFIVFEDQPQV